MPAKIARSEEILRTALLDVFRALEGRPKDTLCNAIGARLRRALNESRRPDRKAEDDCEECQEQFFHWDVTPEQWEHVTGRDHGGPIICRPCFDRRVRRLDHYRRGRA